MALALIRGRGALGALAAAAAAMACGPGGTGPVPVAEGRRELVHEGAPHAAHVSPASLALAPDGTPHLAWLRSDAAGRSVWLARAGDSDFESVRVDAAGSAPAAGHQSPGLAIGPDGRVHLSWTTPRADPGESAFASDLVWTRSLPGALRFGAPERVNADAPGARGFEAIGVGPGGARVAAWIEGGAVSRVRALRVEPDGARREALLDEQACPCCRLAVAAGAGDRFGLLWRDERPGKLRDMVYAVSEPVGDDPALARAVHADGWALDACPHRGGALALAPGGRALVAWYTEGDGGPALRLAWGDAAGFGSPVEVHGDSASQPDRVALALDDDGRGLVLWERRTPVRSEIAARAVLGETAGLGPVRVLSRGVHATGPQLVAAPGGGFVAAWSEEEFPTLRSVVARVALSEPAAP